MKDDATLQTGNGSGDGFDLSRRLFLALPGPGLLMLFHVEPLAGVQEPVKPPPPPTTPTDPNAFLRIGADGRLTCMVGKIEMGQGNMTSLAQLAAEELDVALDSVDMVMGDTDLCPWDGGTWGSTSIRQLGPILRGAAAEARAVLLQMAAEQLQAPAERLQVKAGVVTDPSAKGKQVTYAQLVQGKRIERHLTKVPVKAVAAFGVIGQSPRRKDALEKLTGKGKFAGDILPSGLLHARILRPPAHEAVLKSVDTSAAEKVAGVRVVRDRDLIAVLHEHREAAEQALGLIKAQYDRPQPAVDDKSIFDHLLKLAPPPQVVAQGGSLEEGEKLSATIVEATYLNSYVAHAPIETHSATATMENGRVVVWASTQTPFPLRRQISQAMGIPEQDIRVITPYVGGGFGGKSMGRQAIEAARLTKLAGRPVQVVWERAEEFFYDIFRPAAVVKIRAGLSAAGRIVLWDYIVYGAGQREAKHFYDIPNHRTRSAGETGGYPAGMHPFAVGPWRAPAVNTNTFARESHIDALAAKAGIDPVEFRLNHLSEPRMRRVLETAAKQIAWKPGKLPSGRGFGVACATDVGSPVTSIAQATVNKSTGHVQVNRIVCALDVGVAISPEGMKQQMEGCITMGLGYALSEEVQFRGGEVLNRNFDSYGITQFEWLPKIETTLINNPDSPSSGGGEPAITPSGALVANAIHDAVGVRLLQLPMTPARVLEGLKKV